MYIAHKYTKNVKQKNADQFFSAYAPQDGKESFCNACKYLLNSQPIANFSQLWFVRESVSQSQFTVSKKEKKQKGENHIFMILVSIQASVIFQQRSHYIL